LAADGQQALDVLRGEDSPSVALLDWMMPYISGVDLCRKLRETRMPAAVYLILLTVKDRKEDIVEGLTAGADDYVIKPFNIAELCARIGVGMRMLGLQRELADRIRELETALSQVKQLQRLLPICSYCKSIRDDKNYWHDLEEYLGEHSDTQFTH